MLELKQYSHSHQGLISMNCPLYSLLVSCNLRFHRYYRDVQLTDRAGRERYVSSFPQQVKLFKTYLALVN